MRTGQTGFCGCDFSRSRNNSERVSEVSGLYLPADHCSEIVIEPSLPGFGLPAKLGVVKTGMDQNQTAPADTTQRYLIGECVGQGGLGSVHRAWDARLGRWVAVKRLARSPGLEPEEIEAKITHEANALAALQHPNIVTVHDFGTDEAGPFVVMELIEGANLDKVVEQAPLDAGSFLALAEQSLAGLMAAQRAGLLHRDLKPGNIMLTWPMDGNFQVKILDFGLAKFSPQPQEQTLDQGNALLGSIHFMAPEQFRREPISAQTDLYALGCVFYFALTGANPFVGRSVAETMASHLHHDVAPLAPLRPDLPEPVCDWVMRLISLSPADRPADAAAAAAVLRGLTRATASGDTVGVGLASPVPARLPRRRLILVLAMAGVLTFSGVGAAFLHGWRGTHAQTASLALAVKPTLALASTPAPSPVNVPAPVSAAPTVGSTPTLDAQDLAALRAHLGQFAEVRGTPLATGHSKTGNVLFLNFARPHQGLSLVFFVPPAANNSAGPGARSLESIEPFVNHLVSVQGQISEHSGDLQMVIESLDQIKLLP